MDELLELDLKRYSMKRVPDGPYGPRYRPSSGSAPQLFFDKETLGRLANSVGQLNSDAINDCAQLLQGFYNDVPTTIFSTFLPLATDLEQLWHSCKHTKFWDTEIWIFPIHLPDSHHWALATAQLGSRTLNVFDSLASRMIEDKVINVSSL